MDWFRSYHGAPLDPKWISVAKRAVTHCNACNADPVTTAHVMAVWWVLLDFASQQEPRGSVSGFDPESVADFMGVEEDQVRAILQALREKGVVTDDTVTNWDKRQPKREDDSIGRVRALRERRKGDGNAVKRDVTHGNARGEESRGEEITTTAPSSPAARPNDADALRALFPAVADALPPDGTSDPLLEVMRRVPDPRAYLAEMAAALTGMHGTTLDAAQLRTAVVDWLANQEQPNLRRFRGYLRGVTPKITGPPRTNGHRPSNAQQTYDTTLAALEGRIA